jgi:hypothetical protein
MDKFSDFLRFIETGIFCEGFSLPDIGLPSVQKTSRIEHVMDKKNPIYIGLSDGTKLYFTLDEFRRIEGKPSRGKNMTVIMQRRLDDHSNSPSIITKCIVH